MMRKEETHSVYKNKLTQGRRQSNRRWDFTHQVIIEQS
jgi:hypothetical protein